MSRLLFYSIPLAAAGISSWRWYLQSPRPPEPTTIASAEPVYIHSRFPPLEASDDTAISRRPSVLELHARPLARLRTGDAYQRREAVATLAQLSELNDADCQQLAQALDYQSALLLANWISTDLRLFLPPRGARGAVTAPLELRLRRLLESLPPGTPCAEFWRSRALRHPPAADWEPAPMSYDPADVGAPPPWRSTPAVAVESDCLHALLERADSPSQLRAMVDGGVLDLLAAVHAQRSRDADRCGLIAKILGGFTSGEQLHQAGWLGVLAAWSRETDVRVGPTAWRVIRNLTLMEGLLEKPAAPSNGRPRSVIADDEGKVADTGESKTAATTAAIVNSDVTATAGANAAGVSDAVTSALVILDGHLTSLRSRLLSALSSLGFRDRRPPNPPRRVLRPLPDGVLVLHPRGLAAEAATEVDVVLVHGLLGGTERTWRQSDETRATLPPVAEPRLSEMVLRKRERTGGGMEEGRNGLETNMDRAKSVPRDSKGGGVAPKTGDITVADVTGATVAASSGPDTSHGKCDNTTTDSNHNSRDINNGVNSNNNIPKSDKGESVISIISNKSSTNSSPTTEPYTQCWPRDWLPSDLLPHHVRILSVDYDSAWSDWRPRCAARRARSLSDRAAELRRLLTEAGLGDRPIVWVTHSMGGLLVKQMLVDADREALVMGRDGGGNSQRHVDDGEGRGASAGETLSGDKGSRGKVASGSAPGTNGVSGNAKGSSGSSSGESGHATDHFSHLGDNLIHSSDRTSARVSASDTSPVTSSSDSGPPSTTPLCPLLSSTLGILFISCPHSGSGLASSVSGALRPLLLPSAELDALRRHSPPLLQLREAFIPICHRRGVRCLCVAETRPQPLLGRKVMFVEPDSADAGVGPVVRVDENHLGVCKPRDRDSEVYRLVVRFVREACSGL